MQLLGVNACDFASVRQGDRNRAIIVAVNRRGCHPAATFQIIVTITSVRCAGEVNVGVIQ